MAVLGGNYMPKKDRGLEITPLTIYHQGQVGL